MHAGCAASRRQRSGAGEMAPHKALLTPHMRHFRACIRLAGRFYRWLGGRRDPQNRNNYHDEGVAAEASASGEWMSVGVRQRLEMNEE